MTGPDIITFGCRLNIQESEAMRQLVRESGRPSDDLVIVNGCAVTEEAGRQARQAIRRARRERPQARLVVTGCAAQIEPSRYAGMPEVSHVVGNAEKLRRKTWESLGPATPRILASDIMAARSIGLPRIEHFEGRVRGFVQVQNGCDHRCTFCIIPFGRGRSRSLDPVVVLDQVRGLVAAGYKEVVLTGVDLTSYGADLAGGPRLGALVRRILDEVADLPRLRLSSLDSVEIDDDLLRVLAEDERLMPHLHLSLQSGDDLILKRMKRRHDAAQAIRFCKTARQLRPDIVFGADLIAGFPTETEAMFRNSLDLIEACGLAHCHVFPFSARPDTPAARMPQLPASIVTERARRLRQAAEARFLRCLDGEVGALRSVLGEHGGIARSGQFFPVRMDAPLPPPGTISTVRITGRDGRVLTANLAEPALAPGQSPSFGTFAAQNGLGGKSDGSAPGDVQRAP